VNNDPYGEGWMVKMKISKGADINTLMDVKAYERIVS
jgi:glycine cleavage system H protein